jgi:sensor histidine kinase YesM
MNKTVRKYLLMILALLIIGNLISFLLDPSFVTSPKQWLINCAFSIGAGLPMMKMSEFVTSRYGNKIKWEANPWKRIAVTLGIVIIVSALVTILINFIFIVTILGVSFAQYIKTTLNLMLLQIVIIVFIFTVITGIQFFRMWKEGLLRQESLQRKALELKLEAMKNQVNPHFLFNSLNTLSTLVHKDPDIAVKLISQMSDIYRYILEQKDNKVVEWSVEKQFVENYLTLQQIRFANNIRVQIDTGVKKDFYVVPLSVQMLVENAIKHNVISSDEPLFIQIYVKDDFLVVKNNLQIKSSLKKLVSIGLENIKTQYEILANRKVEVLKERGEFTVKLPLIINPVV